MYHLIPRAVVLAGDDAEVGAVLAIGTRHQVPVVFRAAGTSLSGQGVTDGILVEVARHWKGATVLDGGARIRARPGMIGAHLNAILAPYATRLGPDPSSLAACTLGGILANNSSGPCSGVAQNPYHTLESLRLVLADGTALSTADAEAGGDADARFRAVAPTIHAGLLALRAELVANAPLAARVARKYATKNTTGYGLNALLDFARPIDILAHLMIGSEGTLGFIAEATLRTVPLLPHTATAFLLYPSLHTACDAILPFREAGAEMVELLDDASLRAVAGLPGVPHEVAAIGTGTAALLVQVQCAEAAALAEREARAFAAAQRTDMVGPIEFTRDPAQQAHLLHARKGLYPAVGGARRPGTSVLLEDVAFPVERLARGALDLQDLFAQHHYDDGVIFGHAKDGNLHFLVTPSLEDRASVERYAGFLEDVVELVVGKYDGALKAEHGTGRNMAGFVDREWGPEATDLMRRVKGLLDPAGVLAPGVILPAGPRAHVEHLKTVPLTDAEVDRCVECGYCESACPSRALTLTPRQRIVVRRERIRRDASNDRSGVRALDRDWRHAGLDTCATDGMCGTVCPVGIDTGMMVTRLRAERRSALGRAGAFLAAHHYDLATLAGRAAVRLGHALGLPVPAAGHAAPPGRPAAEARAVYFPSCTGRLLAGTEDPLLRLAERAGVPVVVPGMLADSCCGLPFKSKGFPDAAEAIRDRTRRRLLVASEGGRLPIVVDGSSCTHALQGLAGIQAVDAVTFARRELLPRLTIRTRLPDLALHVTCGAVHAGISDDLRALGAAVAGRVTEAVSNGCCGFAGDRGITHPELTASATTSMAAEFREAGCTRGANSNLTCTIAMSKGTGIPFDNILALLDEVTR